MRLPGRLSAAIAVIEDIEAHHRPVAEALKAWGLGHRFAGAGDRAAIGNLVYDGLRRRASHAYAMASDSPRALVLSVAVRDWGETPVSLNKGFEVDKFAPAPVSVAEAERLLAPDPLAGASDPVRANVPDWVFSALAPLMGSDLVAEGEALAARPPLDLRVNTLKSSPERVLKSLHRFAPQPAAIAPAGIRIVAGEGASRTPNVQVDEAFLKGWFEVQDAGSQIVAGLAGVQQGEQVLDLCAGAGGKTLALAAQMANTGQIFAYDGDRNRLAPIYDRLKRNGVRNAQVRAPGPDALADLVGKMDRVVIDAPCTGTGTWRRRPDAKWKLSPAQLASRVAEQGAILAEGKRFVRPGGVLVYITCSLLPEENERQVASFLAANPDLKSLPPASLWRGAFGDVPAPALTGDLGLTLTPRTTGTDGFFFAAMRRPLPV